MPVKEVQISRKRLYEEIETTEDHVDNSLSISSQRRMLNLIRLHDKTHLCDDCQRLNLIDLLEQRKRTLRACCGVAIADFGKRTSNWNEATCSLCRLFAAVRVTSESFGDEYHLRVVSFLKSCPEVIHCYANKALNNADTICLVVLPGNSRRRHSYPSCSINHDIMRCEKTGYICPVDLSNMIDPPSFGGRLVDAHQPDYRLLQGWVEFCQKRHSRSCIVSPGFRSEYFRVIDCESRSIIKAPLNCTYVALSYVWGSKRSDGCEGHTAECSLSQSLPDTVPRVIQDAVSVTKRLN